MRSFSLFIFIFITFSFTVWGQSDTTKTNRVIVQSADSREFLSDTDPPENRFKGNVKIVSDSSYMFCDSAIITKLQMEAIGDIVIIQDDTINTFADSMIYLIKEEEARLFNNVVLQNGQQKLWTDILVYNINTKIATFQDTALLQNGQTTISSLKGNYSVNSGTAFFREKVVVKDPKFIIKTKSLDYNTKSDISTFKDSTWIFQEEAEIFTTQGYYNMKSDRAVFSNNPTYQEGEKSAIAQRMEYIGAEKMYILTGDAFIQEPGKIAKADTIYYYESTGDMELHGNAFFEDDSQSATGELISYNEETKALNIEGKSTLFAENGTLEFTDKLDYDKELDIAKVSGNVIYKDSLETQWIITDSLRLDNKNKSFLASKGNKKPYLLNISETDSIYICANNLLNKKIIIEQDTFEEFIAYSEVIIYNSEMKGRCDSLYYNSIDSSFKLMRNPIMWTDSIQFTADTIILQEKGDKIDSLFLINNSFMIQEIEEGIYNQIKSIHMEADMDSSGLKKMHAKKNAESIYYIEDEDDGSFIGQNQVKCNLIDFYFKNKELEHVRFYKDPTSILITMENLDASQLYLPGFTWDFERIPILERDILQKNIFVNHEILKEEQKDIKHE